MKIPHLCRIFTLLAATVAMLAHAQPAAKANLTPVQICNHIYALTGDVNVNCSYLSPEQTQMMRNIRDLLTQLVSQQGNLNTISAKLDAIFKAQSRPSKIVISTGPCSNTIVNPSPNSSIKQITNCGDESMKMSDEAFAEYKKLMDATPPNMGLVILLTTYTRDAFELSKQLCEPWDAAEEASRPYLRPYEPYACPRAPGPSERGGRIEGMNIHGGREPSLVCVLGFDEYRIENSSVWDCAHETLASPTPLPGRGTIESVSMEGLFCYSDSWDTPEGVAFKSALKAAGLNCEYSPHSFDLYGIALFQPVPKPNTATPKPRMITVVIGGAKSQNE